MSHDVAGKWLCGKAVLEGRQGAVWGELLKPVGGLL